MMFLLHWLFFIEQRLDVCQTAAQGKEELDVAVHRRLKLRSLYSCYKSFTGFEKLEAEQWSAPRKK